MIQILQAHNQINMKAATLAFLASVLLAVTCLPFRDSLALVNSLEVGRNQDPMAWTCVGCDEENKPIHSAVIEDKGKEIRSILSVYGEYTVLAFRYTANLKNVWQDILWAFQIQDEHAPAGCKVQREYELMWNTIRETVLNGLRKASHTKRLVITGISLGGGLACISYVDIAKAGIFQFVEVVTFGAPRVGNKKWAAWFDTQTPSSRYFIKNDPIAYLPRCLTVICNYRQTGTAIICNKQKQTCQASSSKTEDDQMDLVEMIADIKGEFQEHQDEIMDGDFGGILDHVFGYKKIRDYTLIE